MDLGINKYCTITPEKVYLNGQNLFDIDFDGSPEKSLVQTYHKLELAYPKFFKMDSLSRLAVLAAQCVLKDTEISSKTDNDDVAVVLANASSSLVTDVNYQHTISDSHNYFPSPSLFVYTLPNIAIGEICIRHKIYGSNIFFIYESFNAEGLYFYVNDLFESSNTRHCLVGWLESNTESYEAFLLLVEKGTGIETFDVKTLESLYKNK
jgi:hypothetical protein